MTTKAIAATVSFLMASLLAQFTPQKAPDRSRDDNAFKDFLGTWKGRCADGKEFVVLILSQTGPDLAGTISLGNFEGADGQCTTVVNPPTPEHAMKVTEVKFRGAVLAFKGRQGAEFEMTVDAPNAKLKFLGTPVENNPWQLRRAQ
jgi:hypothetical protein